MQVRVAMAVQVLRVTSLLLFLVDLAPALRHGRAEARSQVLKLRRQLQLLQRFERQRLIDEKFCCKT